MSIVYHSLIKYKCGYQRRYYFKFYLTYINHGIQNIILCLDMVPLNLILFYKICEHF